MNKEEISNELARFSPENKVATYNEFTLYLAEGSQIPHILQEISLMRLKSFDLGALQPESMIDDFDHYYFHLFLMHNETYEILGAYRLGFADKIMERFGKKGLYVSTLYHLADDFFQKTGPLIELGLAFVSPGQGQVPVLPLLFKGIFQTLTMHQYAGVYGLISIANDYTQQSKQLIINCLQAQCGDKMLSTLVSPVYPYQSTKTSPIVYEVIEDINWIISLDKMIRKLESNQKGLPTFLKYYLGVHPKIITFGWDPNFNQVLDCFTVLLLKNIPPLQLERISSVKSTLDKFKA